jgi:hypothetical protein
MRRVLGIVLVAGGLAYLIALAIFAVGTFGLFGAARDPLSGVFLLPLGLPWSRLLDGVAQSGGPWVAILSPIINLAIMAVLYVRAR